MEMQQLFYFVSASALLTLAPGPDILYLLAKSLSGGARSGLVLAAGLCSGLIVHTVLVACGVAAVIRDSPLLFSLLKYFGAAYLLYLAYLSATARDEIRLQAAGAAESLWRLYRRGVMMNLLNPKVILFFLAFLPQFVRPEAGDSSRQIALLGVIFGVQAYCIFAVVAYLAGGIRGRILSIPGLARKLNWFQAAVLLCIAVVLVV